MSIFLMLLFHATPFLIFLEQGCIPLQGSRVNELSASQDEPGRHLFEIVPGEFGMVTKLLCKYILFDKKLNKRFGTECQNLSHE